MSPFEYTSMYFCKESNKLVGTNNFPAVKKRTGILLKENELLNTSKGISLFLLRNKLKP